MSLVWHLAVGSGPPGDSYETVGCGCELRLAVRVVPLGDSCRHSGSGGAWRLAVRVTRQAVWKL